MKRSAFDAAVAHHADRVFTLARYLVRDPGDAEDVTQEVLIKLWTHGSDVEPGRLRAWLLKVTRNACTDLVRRRQRAAAVVPIHPELGAGRETPSREPNPESRAFGSELGERIVAAMARLGDTARSVVVLREVQGLSYREIGEVMEMPTTSVRVVLHRARKRLREALREERDHVAAV